LNDNLKAFVRLYVIAFVLAVALFFIFELNPAITFSIIGSWPLAGSIITIDDDLPGGWSNPDGDEPFPWEMYRALTAFMIVMIFTGLVVSYILNLV